MRIVILMSSTLARQKMEGKINVWIALTKTRKKEVFKKCIKKTNLHDHLNRKQKNKGRN